MRLEKKQLGIFGAAIAMVAVFVLLQYWPLHSRALAIKQIKAAQLSAGTKLEAQVKNLPSLRTQAKQMRENIGNFDAKIPNERQLGAFLQEIAEVMGKYNLKEQLVQPETEVQVDNFNCIPIRMQCKGTLIQIFEFLRSLGSFERLVQLEQLQLKNDQDLNGLVTMVARGNVYYRIQKS
jgi:Tfp pilus assembly protein PilO